jgi:hypothetical protein
MSPAETNGPTFGMDQIVESLATSPPQAAPPPTTLAGLLMPGATSPAGSGGGRFFIDLDRAPQVIADLEAALRRVEEMHQAAGRTGRVALAPGEDVVSINAANQVAKMTSGPEGSLTAALFAYQGRLRETVDGLRAQLRTYHQTEELNTPPASKVPW